MAKELYEYGPILTEDGSEIYCYLKGLTKKQEAALDDGDDESILVCGQVQAFRVNRRYVDHIELDGTPISYAAYVALINEGNYRDVPEYKPAYAVSVALQHALAEQVGKYDGIISIPREEGVAVIVDGYYHGTYKLAAVPLHRR